MNIIAKVLNAVKAVVVTEARLGASRRDLERTAAKTAAKEAPKTITAEGRSILVNLLSGNTMILVV